MMEPEATIKRVVSAICLHVLQASPDTLVPLQGGAQNLMFRVEAGGTSRIVRLNRDCAATYRKEQWAMAQAARVGVPVPNIEAIGHHQGYDYMVLEWIAGTVGSSWSGARSDLYRELGRLARRLGTVKVEGFGWDLALLPSARFTRSWRQAVDKDADYILASGQLRLCGILNDSEIARVHRFMQDYGGWRQPPKLCHNDLCLENLIVGNDGHITLIDWANACGQPGPWFEIARVAASAEAGDLDAFLVGHGIHEDEYANVRPMLTGLSLVHALRAVVWAAQDAPAHLPAFSTRARQLMREWRWTG